MVHKEPITPWLCTKFITATFSYEAQHIRLPEGKYIGNCQYFKFLRGSTKNRSNLHSLQTWLPSRLLAKPSLNNFSRANMFGMVNISNIRDGAQKTDRTSTLRKLYNRQILLHNQSLNNIHGANMLGMVNILNFRDGVRKTIELRFFAKFMTVTFFSQTMLILTTLGQICWEWSIFWIFETMRKKSIEPRHCKNFITITFFYSNYARTTSHRQNMFGMINFLNFRDSE